MYQSERLMSVMLTQLVFTDSMSCNWYLLLDTLCAMRMSCARAAAFVTNVLRFLAAAVWMVYPSDHCEHLLISQPGDPTKCRHLRFSVSVCTNAALECMAAMQTLLQAHQTTQAMATQVG